MSYQITKKQEAEAAKNLDRCTQLVLKDLYNAVETVSHTIGEHRRKYTDRDCPQVKYRVMILQRLEDMLIYLESEIERLETELQQALGSKTTNEAFNARSFARTGGP